MWKLELNVSFTVFQKKKISKLISIKDMFIEVIKYFIVSNNCMKIDLCSLLYLIFEECTEMNLCKANSV